jgi:hypothetical protein
VRAATVDMASQPRRAALSCVHPRRLGSWARFVGRSGGPDGSAGQALAGRFAGPRDGARPCTLPARGSPHRREKAGESEGLALAGEPEGLVPSGEKRAGEPVQGDAQGRGAAHLPSTPAGRRARRAGARRFAGPFPPCTLPGRGLPPDEKLGEIEGLAPSRKKRPGERVQRDALGRGAAYAPRTGAGRRERRAGARRSAGPCHALAGHPGGLDGRPLRPAGHLGGLDGRPMPCTLPTGRSCLGRLGGD